VWGVNRSRNGKKEQRKGGRREEKTVCRTTQPNVKEKHTGSAKGATQEKSQEGGICEKEHQDSFSVLGKFWIEGRRKSHGKGIFRCCKTLTQGILPIRRLRSTIKGKFGERVGRASKEAYERELKKKPEKPEGVTKETRITVQIAKVELIKRPNSEMRQRKGLGVPEREGVRTDTNRKDRKRLYATRGEIKRRKKRRGHQGLWKGAGGAKFSCPEGKALSVENC